jgi:hypothetical protein
MGKFKIDVDEEEEKAEGGLSSVYQHVQAATRAAIDRGEMEKELEKQPGVTMFHVEGHGMVDDNSPSSGIAGKYDIVQASRFVFGL